MRLLCCVAVIWFLSCNVCRSQVIASARCEEDGRLHVTFAAGGSKVMGKERDQVECTDVLIADDRRTVGWEIEVPNCCTSYPIPTAVAVLKDGWKTLFATDQMVWKWRFVSGGKELAMLQGLYMVMLRQPSCSVCEAKRSLRRGTEKVPLRIGLLVGRVNSQVQTDELKKHGPVG